MNIRMYDVCSKKEGKYETENIIQKFFDEDLPGNSGLGDFCILDDILPIKSVMNI